MAGQAEFGAALLDPEAALPEGLADGRGTPASKRFAVYRNNVAVSLTEALQTAFPVVRALVGDQFFQAMAGVYLRAHPPSSPVMMFYGGEMATFLSGFAPAACLPYLPDVARVEQAVRQAYHAADCTPVTGEDLAAIDPEDLVATQFALAPSVHLIESPYPVGSIWRANMAGGDALQARAETTLICRPELDPIVEVLTPSQATFLGALQDGATFGDAAERAGQNPDFDLSACLALCLSRGLLTLP